MDDSTQLIMGSIDRLSARVSKLPTKSDVELAVKNGLDGHVQACLLYQKALAKGVAAVTREDDRENEKVNRVSRMPAAIANSPTWLRILIPIVLAALSAAGITVSW